MEEARNANSKRTIRLGTIFLRFFSSLKVALDGRKFGATIEDDGAGGAKWRMCMFSSKISGIFVESGFGTLGL